MTKPNYNKIYTDIIAEKFPEKIDSFKYLLDKGELSFIDVIKINKKLYGEVKLNDVNQKHRSYDKKAILQILDYQRKKKLTNSAIAKKFKLSRNSIAKWKKIFI